MRKTIDRVLAAVLCASLLALCAVSLVQNGKRYARAFFKTYTTEIQPGDTSLSGNISARISKLTTLLSTRYAFSMPLKTINSTFQYALGKRLLDYGGNTMVTLNNGDLYDLMEDDFPVDTLNEIIAFGHDMQAQDTPVLFAYAHATLYADDLLPSGTEVLDRNAEGADFLLKSLTDAGISVLDSRDVMQAAHLSLSEINLRTDKHWSHRAAFEMALSIAKTLRDNGFAATDPTPLDLTQWTKTPYEKLLLGEYGARVGTRNVQMDDITFYLPAFDTHLTRKSEYYEETAETSGTFAETMTFPERLARDGGEYSTTAYYIYGNYMEQVNTINDDCTAGRVLVFRDSYGVPVSAFLSLTAHEVLAVDMRASDISMQEWVEKFHPDAVVFVYSQQMMRKLNYAFVD